jgi:Dolichyl-phosphate-mannose-protein mannosyltransferase
MKLSQKQTATIAAALLGIMAAMMLSAARQDSATVDETTFLSAGYTYWKGHRFTMVPEHPPLSQMLPAIPLLLMNLHFSPNAQALLEGRAGYPWTRPWAGPIRPWQELFPQGRDNWYFWALPESQLFGQMFVYDGTNDGDAVLFAGRLVQIAITLLAGALIFYWIRLATGNDMAALVGLAAWVFNPDALAHGHLTTTDMGVTFGMTAATFEFARLLENPTPRTAVVCGAATGVALLMKFTAVILAPIFIVLAVLHWRELNAGKMRVWKLAAILIAVAWTVVMLVYFPRWSPAPPLPEAQIRALGVPEWFVALRPALIPSDFFKGLGLTLGHSKGGHEAFLMGRWSHDGWWYYYPVTFFLKSPFAFVLLVIGAAALFARTLRTASPLERTPWVAAIVYLLLAMTSSVNIGVRHLLPMFPLLCVGIGCAAARMTSKPLKIALAVLVAWQAVVTLVAYPLYLQFFNEAVGGAKNGNQYLLDSNYDWGQDARRLKQFLAERGINHIYLDYFGTQYSIEYLKIPNTRVTAEQARQIMSGWLVVSASQLMRPEWAWLRESHQPVTRVAYTLFVFEIGV